ncbi:MAG: hypothetical protein AB7Q97_06430 [Gammaproteobacteria bacterium]
MPAHGLTPALIDRLWACYSRYVRAAREDFVHEVRAADEIVLFVESGSGALAGFDALRVVPARYGGRPCTVLYTSYADIDPVLRGRNLVERVTVGRLLRLKLRNPLRPVFLVYTASTYFSYLILPHNAVEYWPHPRTSMPPAVRSLVDAVMHDLERDGWDPAAGVVRRHGKLRYRTGVVADDPAVLADPDIAFYARLNPGQADGDTLACICPLSLRNLCRAAWRMLVRRFRGRRTPIATPTSGPAGGHPPAV